MSKPSAKTMGLTNIEDTGYTKACPYCPARFGEVFFLAGRHREVRIEKCPEHVDKKIEDEGIKRRGKSK